MAYDFKKTYWCNNGKYEIDQKRFHNALVPQQGMADTTDGEALRCVSNVYYDLYNNGGGNFDVRHGQWKSLKRWLRERGVMAEASIIDQQFEIADKRDGCGCGMWECDYCMGEYIDEPDPYAVPGVVEQMELLVDAIVEYLLDKEKQTLC